MTWELFFLRVGLGKGYDDLVHITIPSFMHIQCGEILKSKTGSNDVYLVKRCM